VEVWRELLDEEEKEERELHQSSSST